MSTPATELETPLNSDLAETSDLVKVQNALDSLAALEGVPINFSAHKLIRNLAGFLRVTEDELTVGIKEQS